MTKVLLATVAILAFTAPSFAQQDKTTGQAPPSGASSFYLAQDTATMKCQVVNAQPAAGGTHHEGYRPGSSDTRISGNSFGG